MGDTLKKISKNAILNHKYYGYATKTISTYTGEVAPAER